MAWCLQPDGCFAVCVTGCACAHAENNITCLTLPFFFSFFFFSAAQKGATRAAHKHTHTHSLSHADMCSAQPVITAALMWSLGGTEASYYCRFMTTFALWLLPACPPLSFLSLSPSLSPLSSLSTFHSIPPSKPTSIFLPAATGRRLFVCSAQAILSHLWGRGWI